jgi:1-acyl-sn-glycerol-3-phosphate acyltransferase
MKHLRPWIKFSGVFIMLCWYLGQLLVYSAIKGKNTDRGFRYRRKFCSAALAILNIDYQQEGQLQPGACLYVSNHRSMLDPLIQLGYIDAFIVSKAEVGNYPVLGRGARETGIILVHRHDHNSRKAALDAIEEKLLSGYQVLIYPEATTHGGDLTGEFKKGAIEMACRKGIPIVPVMIEYPDAGYYWTDGSLLSYFIRLFTLRTSHHVSGRIGLPMQSESPDTIVEDTRALINQMIIDARSGPLRS